MATPAGEAFSHETFANMLTAMYYNNLLTIPVLVFCSLVTEDWSSANLAKNFPEESRNRMMIGIIYSGLAAIFISYCSAW